MSTMIDCLLQIIFKESFFWYFPVNDILHLLTVSRTLQQAQQAKIFFPNQIPKRTYKYFWRSRK